MRKFNNKTLELLCNIKNNFLGLYNSTCIDTGYDRRELNELILKETPDTLDFVCFFEKEKKYTDAVINLAGKLNEYTSNLCKDSLMSTLGEYPFLAGSEFHIEKEEKENVINVINPILLKTELRMDVLKHWIRNNFPNERILGRNAEIIYDSYIAINPQKENLDNGYIMIMQFLVDYFEVIYDEQHK